MTLCNTNIRKWELMVKTNNSRRIPDNNNRSMMNMLMVVVTKPRLMMAKSRLLRMTLYNTNS